MGGKGSFFILLVIIAILTLALTILVGYLFVVAGVSQTRTEIAQGDITVKHLPDSELSSRRLFSDKQFFNLKCEEDKMSVIQVNVILYYYKKVKGIKNVEEKLSFNESKIKQMIGTYFQKLTLDDVKKPETKERAANELKKAINDYLITNEEQKADIVYEVVFDEWFYQ